MGLGGRRDGTDATPLRAATVTGFVTGAAVGLAATLLSVPLRRLSGVSDRSMINGLTITAGAIAVWTVAGLLFAPMARRGRGDEWLFSAAVAFAALVSAYVYLDEGPLTPYPTRFASLAVPLIFVVLVAGALLFRLLIVRPVRLPIAAPGGLVAAVLVAVLVTAGDRAPKVHFTLSKLPAAPAAAAVQNAPSQNAPVQSQAVAATPSPAPMPVAPLHFTVSSQSQAAYTVREKLAQLPGPSDAVGKTQAITGDLYLDPGKGVSASPPSSFSVDLRTLTSDAPPRDRYVRTNSLQTDQFPMATFTIATVEGFPVAYHEGDEVKLTLTGTFDVHGVQKPLTWTGTARYANNQLEAVMSTDFDMHDFNVTPPEVSIAKAESAVHLDLHLFATQAGS